MNVLTKKCRGFVKRAAAYIVAGAVAVSLIPMAVSAEDTAAVPRYWETVTEIGMDGFTSTKTGIWGVEANKTVDGNEVTVETNSGASPYLISAGSGFCDVPKEGDITVDVPDVVKNNKLFVLDRHNAYYQWWQTPSIKSGIRLRNLIDTNKIHIGDKVRVTVYVYAADVCEGQGNFSNKDVNQYQDVHSRIWLTDLGQSNETGYNKNADETKETSVGKIPANKWTELSLEFEVTSANSTAASIELNNNPGDASGIYPALLYIAGAKVEKLENGGWYAADANGNATGEIYVNNSGVAEDSKVMVAAYEGDTFIGCDILDVNGEVSPFSVTGAAKADKVCAYVWDMTTLKPQADIIGLTKAE